MEPVVYGTFEYPRFLLKEEMRPCSYNNNRVTILGALNVDYVFRVNKFPTAGETNQGESIKITRGGKAGNSAVFCKRLFHGSVHLLGCVGNDMAGQNYLEFLEEEEVDIEAVEVANTSTGSAGIFVESSSGENFITIIGGANKEFKFDEYQQTKPGGDFGRSFSNGDDGKHDFPSLFLCQNELPFDITLKGLQIASKFGCYTMLNLAPSRPLEEVKELLLLTDILVVNLQELWTLMNMETAVPDSDNGESNSDELKSTIGNKCVELLENEEGLKNKIEAIVVTCGGAGACVFYNNAVHISDNSEGDYQVAFFKGQKVKNVVDTTGAGDAFCGALAARLMKGNSIMTAVQIANLAAAQTVVNEGAQESYPQLADMNLPDEDVEALDEVSRTALEYVKVAEKVSRKKTSKKRSRS